MLCDDPLESVVARCPEQLCSRHVEGFREADRGFWASGDQFFEEMSTHPQFRRREIVAVEIHEIEGHELCRRGLLTDSAAKR